MALLLSGGDLRSAAFCAPSLLSSLPLSRSRPTSLTVGVSVAQGRSSCCLSSGVEFLILSLCEVAFHCWDCSKDAGLSETLCIML